MPTSTSTRRTTTSRPAGNRPTLANRGFTLIELMIAMVAAVSVTMAAFLLSKGASRFFQHEARISTAQLAVSMGMNRMVADIERASFMSSPNISPSLADSRPKDRAVCQNGALPATLANLSGIRILQGSAAALPVNAMNNFVPDQLTITGTFGTTEQFAVQAIVPGASGLLVYLQPNSAAMGRTTSNADMGAASGAVNDPLSLLFKPGRLLRVVDQAGGHEYGIITSYVWNNGQPWIGLAQTPALAQKTPGTTCGFSGFCVGCLVNPIARVQYDIRSRAALAATAVYTSLVQNDTSLDAVTGDDNRTELVREEMSFDPNNPGAMPGTLEIVAEYAVDLRFGIEMLGTVGGPAPGANPGIGVAPNRIPIANPANSNVYTVAANPLTPNSMPERIRSVQVRLSTRSRAPDRETDVPYNDNNTLCQPLLTTADSMCYGPDGRRLRYNVSNSPTFGSKTRFARVRTQYADVALPNQMGIVW